MIPVGMQTCCCYGASAIIIVNNTAKAASTQLAGERKKNHNFNLFLQNSLKNMF